MDSDRNTEPVLLFDEQEQSIGIVSRQSRKQPTKQSSNTTSIKYAQFIMLTLCVFLVGLLLGFKISESFASSHHSHQKSREVQHKLQSCAPIIRGQPLPQILWVFSEIGWEAEPGHLHIYVYHLKAVAAKNNFQVRVVDSWNAYDWISPEMSKRVSNTIQNTRIDESVANLLKLALLIENGGVMIGNLDSLILTGSLQWVQSMFGRGAKGEKLTCDPSQTQVYMPSFKDPHFGTKYYENVIAALPRARLLYDTFLFLENVLLKGIFPGNDEVGVIGHNAKANVAYLDKSIENSLSMVLRLHAKESKSPGDECQHYGMQGTVNEAVVDLSKMSTQNQGNMDLLFKHKWEENVYQMAINVNSNQLKEKLEDVFKDSQSIGLSQQSIMYQVLKTPGNEEVFLQPLPHRDIQLCLVVMEGLDQKGLQEMASSYQEQTYHNWRLVLFAKDEVVEAGRENVEVVKSSGNEVRNIEVAVTRHCDHKGYAVMLHHGDKFSSPKALELIAEAVKDRQVVGAAIDLEHQGKLYKAKEDYLSFSRSVDNTLSPKTKKMEGILNNFRIFAIESFRYLPQFELRDMYGQYYEDRLIFLMSLLELIKDLNPKGFQHLYIFKKYAPVFNVPQKACQIPEQIRIVTTQINELNQKMLMRTKARTDVESISLSIKYVLDAKIRFSKLLVFNNGDEYVSPSHMAGPDIIPQVIHQIWLGENMPASKSYLYKKAQKMYPNFEMRLWGKPNITTENFPFSYQVLMNMLKQSGEKQNKLSSITEVMVYEILYHKGGFWRDMSLNVLRPVFNQFLKYNVVVRADQTGRHRWNQGTNLYASVPRVKHLQRVTGYPSINKIRVLSGNPLKSAGLFDFMQMMNDYEEGRVLVMAFDTIHPDRKGFSSSSSVGGLCTRVESTYQDEPYDFKDEGCYLLSGCEKLYPYAIALIDSCPVSSQNKLNDL